MKFSKIFMLIGMLFMWSCNSSSNNVKKTIENIKSSTFSNIETLPEFKDYTPVPYNNKYNDPFDSLINQNITNKSIVSQPIKSQSKRPDFERTREYLESFPLDTLVMVGILERKNEIWALIVDRSGILHKVKKGNYLGQNSGKIIDLNEDSIDIEEIVIDGQGGWTNRNASIKMKSK